MKNHDNREQNKIALIPSYEPDDNLTGVASALCSLGFNVIIVDDGSGEEYRHFYDEAEKFASKVIHYDTNSGKGTALKTGLKYIYDHFDAPYTVVTVDSDGQHKPEDALKVWTKAKDNSAALVLGSRRFTGSVPIRSRFGNTVTRFVYRLSSGVKVYDTQTGLRAFSCDLIPYLMDISGDRYEYEMNMLMQFARDKKPIIEEWIETVYLNDNESTHFDTIRDSYAIYKEILKFSGSSLIGFLVDYAMYCLLLAISGHLVFSNVCARIVSASVNYTLNRRVVFKSDVPLFRSVMQYAFLAVLILLINTLLLKVLTGIGLNRYLIKIPVEIIMFGFSWIIQHTFIFNTKQ